MTVPERPAGCPLSAREHRAQWLYREGRTAAEVAAALAVSVFTVRAQIQAVYRKLGVRSRSQLRNEIPCGSCRQAPERCRGKRGP